MLTEKAVDESEDMINIVMDFFTLNVTSRLISWKTLYIALDIDIKSACEPHPLLAAAKKILMQRKLFHLWNLENVKQIMSLIQKMLPTA
jgi:hypothetical protein